MYIYITNPFDPLVIILLNIIRLKCFTHISNLVIFTLITNNNYIYYYMYLYNIIYFSLKKLYYI